MNSRAKLTLTVAALTAMPIAGFAVAASAAPILPPEQQALVDAGYAQTLSWKFDKQHGQCHITVEVSGKNYYVLSKGKLSATLYPVRPAHVLEGANFLDTNCQS